jgi:hypothetical protein
MRRKIPILNVQFREGATWEDFYNIPEMRTLIIETTKEAIEEGMKSNKKSVPLFKLHNSRDMIILDKKEWKSSLTEILNYCVENEDYNTCIDIKEMINQL